MFLFFYFNWVESVANTILFGLNPAELIYKKTPEPAGIIRSQDYIPK